MVQRVASPAMNANSCMSVILRPLVNLLTDQLHFILEQLRSTPCRIEGRIGFMFDYNLQGVQ